MNTSPPVMVKSAKYVPQQVNLTAEVFTNLNPPMNRNEYQLAWWRLKLARIAPYTESDNEPDAKDETRTVELVKSISISAIGWLFGFTWLWAVFVMLGAD